MDIYKYLYVNRYNIETERYPKYNINIKVPKEDKIKKEFRKKCKKFYLNEKNNIFKKFCKKIKKIQT